MSQKFSLYELLTVDQNIRLFGGSTASTARAVRRAAPLRARDGRPRGPRDDAAARPAGRLAPAPGARLRDPPRAADPLPRRADRRRRPDLAAPVLAPDRPALALGRHRARDDALPGRGGVLPPDRAHPRRAAGGARHDERAEADLRGPPDRRGPHADSRSTSCGRSTRWPRSRRRSLFGTAVHAVLRSRAVSTGRHRRPARRPRGSTSSRWSRLQPSLEDVFLDVVEKAARE